MKVLVSLLCNRCGYPAVNASFYDLSFHPISSNKDCRLYKNSKAIKCYNCDSCKYVSLNSVHISLYMEINSHMILHSLHVTHTTKGWSGTVHENRVEGCCNLQRYSLCGPGKTPKLV